MQYSDLRKVKLGTRVVFTQPWDIYPITVIPEGATGVIHDAGDHSVSIMPDDTETRDKLKEWDGCIEFYPEDAEPDEYELPISIRE